MHDTKIANLGTLGREKNTAAFKGGPLDDRLGTSKGQMQSTSLVPASLAQREKLCLRGESLATGKQHLLV